MSLTVFFFLLLLLFALYPAFGWMDGWIDLHWGRFGVNVYILFIFWKSALVRLDVEGILNGFDMFVKDRQDVGDVSW